MGAKKWSGNSTAGGEGARNGREDSAFLRDYRRSTLPNLSQWRFRFRTR